MSTLADDLRELGRLKRIEKILNRRKREVREKRVLHERAVYDRMQAEGYKPKESSVRLEGIMYIPKSTTYASVQNRAKLIKYLREHDSGLIEERVLDSELNRMVNHWLDNNQGIPPESGLGYYEETTIQTRGITKKDKDTKDIEEDEDGEE